jgi:DCN1-like protein 1/2
MIVDLPIHTPMQGYICFKKEIESMKNCVTNLPSYSFYATNGIPAPGGKEKEREALAKLFEKYRGWYLYYGVVVDCADNLTIEPDDEEDTAGLDGTMKYLEDLGVDMETAEFLVPLEIIGAPVVGEIAKAGFVDGWKSFGYVII